jgi:tetratricopeptide (TPR) repeat protein
MSTTIQPLAGIKPLAESGATAPTDPVLKDYEEGKKALENGEFGAAALALHNALVGYSEKNNSAGIANASNQLGHLCLARKEYDAAKSHYLRALEICDQANDRMSVLAVNRKLVEVYLGLENTQAALNVCLDILDIYHDNRDPQGTVAILEEMATIYLATGEKEKAADAFRTISSLHKNFGHVATAEKYLEKAKQLVDTN